MNHEWLERIATAYDEASDQATGAWDVWALATDFRTSGLASSEMAGLRFRSDTASSLPAAVPWSQVVANPVVHRIASS